MRNAAFERIFLRDEYLRKPSEQMKIKWYAASETLRSLLESASESLTDTEQKALLQDARKNFDATVSLFSAILEKHGQNGHAGGKTLVLDEEESTVIGQVFLNAYALNDNLIKLHESSNRAAITARNRGMVIVFFILASVIAIIINSIIVTRIISKRFTSLQEGIEIIGGGNLDYRIDEEGDDELSALAHSSNEMITKLKESQEFSENVINSVREPLIALDQDLRVVKVSRSFYEFFKVKPEETLGQLIYDLGNKQWDIPKLRELLETILPQKATFDNYEVEHDFTGIGRRVMLLNARQIQRGLGKERIILLAIEDITERKRAEGERITLERQLLQARKAESLGRMASAIAHYFNNKLMVVMGNLELALYSVGPNEKLSTLLLQAQTGASQAAEVSGLMLTYLGQALPKTEVFNLAKVCREVVETQMSSIPQRVTMMIDIPPHGPTIKANQAQVRQVLSNLIVNAWEAIGEGEGEIRVSLRIVDATETSSPHIFPADWKPDKDTYACLEVSDTACGIDPEQLDLIFDPFFSTRFTGRGLGLAVVLGTVRSYGGAIAVASEPGRGSIFQVFWTIAEPEAQTVHKAEADVSKPIEGLRLVLFVDDEAQLRNMAELMLGHLGFRVIQAGHGLEAVEIFRERKDEINLVILDLTMPGMNGWETLAALRALRLDIPVVLASGYDEAKAMEGEHAELPQAFLHKPYRMAELKAALAAAAVASSFERISSC